MNTPNKSGVPFHHSVFLIANECDCRADHGAEGKEHLKTIAAMLREAIAEREGMKSPEAVRLEAICAAVSALPGWVSANLEGDDAILKRIDGAKADYEAVLKLENTLEKLCDLVGAKSYDAVFGIVEKLNADLSKAQFQQFCNPALGVPFDGGPAFPLNLSDKDKVIGWDGQSEPVVPRYPGMSLRDYFAANAMMGLYANPKAFDLKAGDCARWAYHGADAMLEARTEKKESAK